MKGLRNQESGMLVATTGNNDIVGMKSLNTSTTLEERDGNGGN